MLKYKCLVLDHDDTVVRSTPEIHFPVFKNTLFKLRPSIEITLDEFMMYCFDPGFNSLCFDMAKSCNVDFASAGWSHTNSLIIEFMKKNCDYYFNKVEELEKFLFE